MQTITQQIIANDLHNTAKNIGVVMMTFAATFGMVVLPEAGSSKMTVSAQPALSFATEHSGSESSSHRREREETGPHYTSYGATQRTPGRTGSV